MVAVSCLRLGVKLILGIVSYPKVDKYTLNVMALKLPRQDCKVIELHPNVLCVQ
jgi:hypothetical protein